jgi:hypothetical protein
MRRCKLRRTSTVESYIGIAEAFCQALSIEEMFQQFKKLFPTEEACWCELIRAVQEHGIFRCRNCGGSQFEHLGGRKILCQNCHLSTSITVGTLFERIRRAEPWLAAMWLMERGVILTSSAFHKLVDVAQSTALVMLRKIRLVLESSFDETARLVASKQFKRLMCRRSLETPARLHPSSEDDFRDCEHAANGKDSECFAEKSVSDLVSNTELESQLDALPPSMREKAKTVLQHLANGALSYDELCSMIEIAAGPLNSILAVLEIAGLVHDIGGGRFVLMQSRSQNVSEERRCERTSTRGVAHGDRRQLHFEHDEHSPPNQFGERSSEDFLPPVVTTDLALAKSVTLFILRKFSGVSRKYLQLYLVALWCCVDRDFWTEEKIFKQCYLAPPLPYRDSLTYISDVLLKLKVGQRNAA